MMLNVGTRIFLNILHFLGSSLKTKLKNSFEVFTAEFVKVLFLLGFYTL